MAIPDYTRQVASNAVAAMGNYFSVHEPPGAGTTGANEASGGNYIRKPISWTEGSNGINTSDTANIPVAGDREYLEGGIWSDEYGGTFVGSDVFAGGLVIVSGLGASIDLTGIIRV